ncbi:hypothetical protein [Pseudanabaena sp. FACHB-2040]|uniref:hypothetical protein n=1 Tax=Pseudanabaena sp. FACHB-2040 TaxID=2692859 RepID=UPI0016888657|nr:hypothetical protein [Pseudanabaena sp. FACHB-2040]MBD2258769.1 hypothetical protein [Pseudanabaena sp. FACHB-2040]
MSLNRAFTLAIGTAVLVSLTAGLPLFAQETMEPPGVLVAPEESLELPESEEVPTDGPMSEADLEEPETDELLEEPGAEDLMLEASEVEPALFEESGDFDFDAETGAEVDGTQNVIESIEAPEPLEAPE